MCPKGRAQNRNGGKMKKKAVEKVEMKESLLKGEALALNDAELECAAGGAGVMIEVQPSSESPRCEAVERLRENFGSPNQEEVIRQLESQGLIPSGIIQHHSMESWQSYYEFREGKLYRKP